MSIGIAVWEPHEDLDGLLARADSAMYQAKRGGKGSFTIAAPAAPLESSKTPVGA